MAQRRVAPIDFLKTKYQDVNRWFEAPSYLHSVAHRPEILDALVPLQTAILGPGKLDQRLKSLVYLAASFVNESPYCITRFRSLAAREGWGQNDIRAVQTEQDHNFTPKERAALRIARDLTRNCTVDDLESNEMSLFSDDEFVELVSVVCLANFDNRFVNAIDLSDDDKSEDSDSLPKRMQSRSNS